MEFTTESILQSLSWTGISLQIIGSAIAFYQLKYELKSRLERNYKDAEKYTEKSKKIKHISDCFVHTGEIIWIIATLTLIIRIIVSR